MQMPHPLVFCIVHCCLSFWSGFRGKPAMKTGWNLEKAMSGNGSNPMVYRVSDHKHHDPMSLNGRKLPFNLQQPPKELNYVTIRHGGEDKVALDMPSRLALVRSVAKTEGVNPALLYGLARAETDFVSRTGMGYNKQPSFGLMQMELNTGRNLLNVKDDSRLQEMLNHPTGGMVAAARLIREGDSYTNRMLARNKEPDTVENRMKYMSVHYNLGTKARNAFDGDVSNLPKATQQHIEKVVAGVREYDSISSKSRPQSAQRVSDRLSDQVLDRTAEPGIVSRMPAVQAGPQVIDRGPFFNPNPRPLQVTHTVAAGELAALRDRAAQGVNRLTGASASAAAPKSVADLAETYAAKRPLAFSGPVPGKVQDKEQGLLERARDGFVRTSEKTGESMLRMAGYSEYEASKRVAESGLNNTIKRAMGVPEKTDLERVKSYMDKPGNAGDPSLKERVSNAMAFAAKDLTLGASKVVGMIMPSGAAANELRQSMDGKSEREGREDAGLRQSAQRPGR